MKISRTAWQVRPRKVLAFDGQTRNPQGVAHRVHGLDIPLGWPNCLPQQDVHIVFQGDAHFRLRMTRGEEVDVSLSIQRAGHPGGLGRNSDSWWGDARDRWLGTP